MSNTAILKDIPYGNHSRQVVDLFIPQAVRKDKGLILFIHGGGWSNGDKSVHHPDAEYFSRLGYISATMNYRFVSDELDVFCELDDITSALARIKQVCAEHGYNTERVILSGGSAGGHLSLVYAYTRVDEAPITPVAVCPYCPPPDCSKPDFLLGISGEFEAWKYSILSQCCGCTVTKETFMDEPQQAALHNISPIKYLTTSCVPTAVFYSKHDELIPRAHTEEFINMLKEVGVKNDTLLFENSNHAMDKDPDASQQAKNIIDEYAEMYL